MKKRIEVRRSQLIRNIIVTIWSFVLVLTFALIALKMPFMGPIAEAVKEFGMTDVYCQILQDTNDGEDEEIGEVTIVDMTELYSRRELAEALEAVENQHPKTIGVDVVFEGLKEDSVGDEMMAEVALNNDNIIFSYKLLDYANDSIGYTDAVHSFFAEDGEVMEGFTNMQRNLYGGIKRQLSLGRKAFGKLVPSFITMTVDHFQGRKTEQVEDRDVNINFIPRRHIVVHPDSIALHPEYIKGKLVLFGAMKDEYDMHYTPLGKMAGTELLAYSLETLLDQCEVKHLSNFMTALISFLLVLLTQTVFARYLAYARRRKNRFLRFLMSATFTRTYLMFFWIGVCMWFPFILFYQYDISLNIAWALSAMALLTIAQSIVDEFMASKKDKNDKDDEKQMVDDGSGTVDACCQR